MSAPVAAPGAARAATTAAALQQLLRVQNSFVGCLAESLYSRAPASGGSPIGSHVRHALDHVSALLCGFAAGCIDYDSRQRGGAVEHCAAAALARTRELAEALTQLSHSPIDSAVSVRTLLAAAGPVIVAPSSLGRELTFVLSHTIHHHAMMAAVARELGAPVPARFGYAPSTIAREVAECARSAS